MIIDTPINGVLSDTDRRDTLIGTSLVSDTFVLSRDGKTDTVTRFKIGEDIIDLTAFDVGFDQVYVQRLSNIEFVIQIREESTRIQLEAAAPGEPPRAQLDLSASDFIFKPGVATAPLQTHSDTSSVDRLVGTTLPDAFVFIPDGTRDAIRRFEIDKDVINLGAFATSFSSLTFVDKKPGRVMIRVDNGPNSEDIVVTDGTGYLTAADFAADDFIF